MLVPPAHPPHITRFIDARLVWMDHQPLDLRRQYMIKHTSQWVKAQVRYVRYRVDVNSFQRHPASELKLNEIGTVVIDLHSPLFSTSIGAIARRAASFWLIPSPM